MLFRPEKDLYSTSQVNNYSYKWDDFEKFVCYLKENSNIAINRFRLEYLTNMMHCLKTSWRNRAILSDYHNRAATR